MGDPFAPKSRRTVGETADPLEAVLARLRRCGADDEDLENAREGWPPPQEVIDWLLGCSDDELRAEIARVAEEYQYATTTEEEQAELDAAAHIAAAEAGVAKALASNVGKSCEWIGDDPVRALVALNFEDSELGSGRKGVKDHARRVIDANA